MDDKCKMMGDRDADVAAPAVGYIKSAGDMTPVISPSQQEIEKEFEREQERTTEMESIRGNDRREKRKNMEMELWKQANAIDIKYGEARQILEQIPTLLAKREHSGRVPISSSVVSTIATSSEGTSGSLGTRASSDDLDDADGYFLPPLIPCFGEYDFRNRCRFKRAVFPNVDEAMGVEFFKPGEIAALYQGSIFMKLTEAVTVEITTDGGIRLNYANGRISMAVNADADIVGFIHSVGRVYKYGNKVELNATGLSFRGPAVRFAQVTDVGIAIKCGSMTHPIYWLDQTSVKCSKPGSKPNIFFSSLNYDFTAAVFQCGSNFGANYVQECMKHVDTAKYSRSENHEKWVINGVKIKMQNDGFIRVISNAVVLELKVEGKETASLKMNDIHITASLGINKHDILRHIRSNDRSDQRHLYLRKDNKRVHFNDEHFSARNGDVKAGFNKFGQFTVI